MTARGIGILPVMTAHLLVDIAGRLTRLQDYPTCTGHGATRASFEKTIWKSGRSDQYSPSGRSKCAVAESGSRARRGQTVFIGYERNAEHPPPRPLPRPTLPGVGFAVLKHALTLFVVQDGVTVLDVNVRRSNFRRGNLFDANRADFVLAGSRN